MTPKPITAADAAPTVRVVIVTLDRHIESAVDRARVRLARAVPGLRLSFHAAAEWGEDPEAAERARADIAEGDVIFANMLFLDEHVRAVLPALEARREACDAMIGTISGGEVIRLTKLGRLRMDAPQTGALALLKRLRGSKSKTGSGSGAKQMAMLRRLPKILKYIPGKAQDLRAYFLSLQYWLAGSDANIENLVRFLIDRYADGERIALRGALTAAEPECYPDIGVYHPRLPDRVGEDAAALPRLHGAKGSVGLLLMRSYVLSGDSGHYDAAIAAFEARGLRVVPAFASGLDGRPAIERYFVKDGRATVDAVVSLTGFSLVGGPAYNDAAAAEKTLSDLDVPYLSAHALEFQTLEQWSASDRGLSPIESTMMVAIPEIDGATGPIVFGGRSERAAPDAAAGAPARAMRGDPDRCAMLAARVERLVRLRRTPKPERKLGIVLFNFPPNAGATGTAAFLSVFESLFNTLHALKRDGYAVEPPESVDALRARILGGDADRTGADANVAARVAVDDHVRREKRLGEIEAQWGPAPGRHQTDGRSLFVLGATFGSVFVGVQPAFGYEGDPMRLLFERGFAPTHAFAAFYRWLREDFGADALLHFGTHGALEFMPGKQTGLCAECWPDYLIDALPNFYLYAGNNPSEGAIAKRRAAATLISHLTPPVAKAGLYRGLVDLKSSLERWRGTAPEAIEERARLAEMIQAQAAQLDLAEAEPAWDAAETRVRELTRKLLELEYALIPHGLHVVGRPPSDRERAELLMAIATASETALSEADAEAIVAGRPVEDKGAPERLAALQRTARLLAEDHEIPALLHALDGRFTPPAPGGDLIRTPAMLPTGRNIHGFDPFRIPSAYALADGARQTERLIARHAADGHQPPETVAIVLWGADNLKTEGAPIGQALALIGAKPRLDSYGRLCGAELVDLETLGRPRIDVLATLSGIFRDLLPLQTKLLAEAAYLAAVADEPVERNFVRKHALALAEARGCSLEEASVRVFSNADGAYGSNVNHMIDSGAWVDEDELAETFTKRKCFAYGASGKPTKRPEMLESLLGTVDIAFQNLESVELGVTTIDHYFDTLGGVGRAVRRARGEAAPVYIGDATAGPGAVRSLAEQIALETRTRTLNPKWHEGMLSHGYEGVRQIEAHVTNTLGWSATTDQVAPWVYQRISQTFMLDEEMRRRMSALNPKASAKVASRLLEAHERRYWEPDDATLDALRAASEELEDRLEGVAEAAA